MNKNRITVYVAGQKFTLITEDNEKYVSETASRVDTAINSVFAQTNMSKERCAILLALDLCDDEQKARKEIVEIREQIKDYMADSAKLREKITLLEAQIQQLTEENNILKKADADQTKQSAEQNTDLFDDLSFDDVVVQKTDTDDVQTNEQKPQQKTEYVSEKKRHNHEHINPYKAKYAQNNQKPEKGYTPTRQYSLFDNN